MQKSVILLNMGGPNNLDEVKTFLTNMFNDKNIIAAPSPIRKMIAWFITTTRLKEAKSNYAHLGGKSPILGYTEKLVKALESKIDAKVDYAMRYTPPFSKEVLERLQNSDEIYAIPLYPHYSSTTTLSSFEDLMDEAKKLGIDHKIRTIDSYYKDPAYINSIVERVKETLGDADPSDYELVFSAHGLPQKIIDKGDKYQRHIRYTLFYARKALMLQKVNFHKTHLAYQSRLGPMEWIRPYLEDKLKTLTKKKVIIFPIAFTVDNSETEFELDIEYKEIADELGFEEYKVAKAPNDHPLFVDSLKGIYEKMKKSA
ncbi:MAG: Ferrochelatase, protoheme ferro-lyase (EC [uncultured Sulfurovum sp.]|uniref:Ferrochelatase n=1 Tax=uncultured Sulfurovum sp. TaxID=269237 RepID=A0A6S6TH83_9BACT|nr:MAG: Ferrochelatase, protoheme ferro-lyase (EC [uncultured Sulfurovum sp.]